MKGITRKFKRNQVDKKFPVMVLSATFLLDTVDLMYLTIEKEGNTQGTEVDQRKGTRD